MRPAGKEILAYLQDCEAEMLADLQAPVLADYGIEVKTLGIKQLKVSEDVTKDVFERMKADRQRRTEATIAQGDAEAQFVRQLDRFDMALQAVAYAEGGGHDLREFLTSAAAVISSTLKRNASRWSRRWSQPSRA